MKRLFIRCRRDDPYLPRQLILLGKCSGLVPQGYTVLNIEPSVFHGSVDMTVQNGGGPIDVEKIRKHIIRNFAGVEDVGSC